MNEKDIVEIIKDTADRWHTMFYSVYVKQHYGEDITVFYEAVAKAIMDKIKADCNLCYEAMAEKSNKAMTELMVDNSKVSEENRLLKAKLSANRFIFNTFERHKYQDKIEELEEKLREFEINEDEKFGITEIEGAVKEVYSVVSKGTLARIYQILTDNRKQHIKNMEAM